MSLEPLVKLHTEQGQSAWLDNLRRDDITSGRLRQQIISGIRGQTSNPTIFQKAIQDSTAYDEQIRSLLAESLSTEEIYWTLVCADIQRALDLFRPLYEESSGNDGYVSVEVDPHLARDTQGTYNAAWALWKRIDRPNLMIKIPATVESLPAIRAMVASGANINVTLIFSLERYRDVMLAYIGGLADRVDQGFPIDSIAGVASFFISRVDTEIDRRLDSIGTAEALALRGQAAVCQARLAYSMFREVFSGEAWSYLERHRARAQRPLWASTSTKNPAYPDTLYVDELIGPDTVNTLPESTIDAFCDHGSIARTIDRNVEASRHTWEALSHVGIDVADVARVLEDEGLKSFQTSFDDLMTTLSIKRV
ncbi:MAG: transaldolase [Actinomycetota bacterium]